MTAAGSEERLSDLRDQVRSFALERVRPRALEIDRQSIFDRELFREMGTKRWTGPLVPKDLGGMGAGAREYSLIIEELAAACGPTPQINVQVEHMLLAFGTADQRSRYLPGLADGSLVAAEAISEASAGSTLRTIETRARRDGDDYVITGTKSHVNLAGDADVIAVFATTAAGLSVFLADAGANGMNFVKQDPVGYRAHPIYDVKLEECRVPARALLAAEGRGYEVFFRTFDLSRIGNTSHFIGLARAALEDAIAYISERRVGQTLVKDFQGVRWLVADLATRLESVIVMRDHVAALHDRGAEHAKETAMAKLLAAELADEITSKAMQLTGSYGVYRNRPFELYWRDVKALQIGGGTSEVMRNLIARAILGKEEGS